MSVSRPFRRLCPEADARDAMSDDEFWAHVFPQAPYWEPEDAGEDVDSLNATPCEECGASGACGYDSEGRPMIHTTPTPSEEP